MNPPTQVDIDACSRRCRVVKQTPHEADRRALKDHGRHEGGARRGSNPDGDVDGGTEARKDGEGKESKIKIQNGQFREHEHEGIVYLRRVNKLDPSAEGTRRRLTEAGLQAERF